MHIPNPHDKAEEHTSALHIPAEAHAEAGQMSGVSNFDPRATGSRLAPTNASGLARGPRSD